MLVGQLGSSSLALITAPIIARAIGVEGRGLTAGAIAIATVAPTLLALGVPLEIRRLAAHGISAATLRASRALAVISFAPSCIGAVAIYFAFLPDENQAARLAAAVGVALAPVAITWMSDLSVLVAQHRFGWVMVMQLANPTVLLISVSLMLVFDVATPSLVIYASSVGSVVTMVVGLSAVRSGRASGQDSLRDLLRRSRLFAPAPAIDMVANRLALVLAVPILGTYQAGLLSISMTTGMILVVVGQTIAGARFSQIAREDSAQLIERSVREVGSLALLGAILGAAATPLLVPLIFGEPFRAAVPATVVCVFAGAAVALTFAVNSFLVARGRARSTLVMQTVGLVIQLALIIALQHYGAMGVAIAFGVGYSAAMLTGLRLLDVKLRHVVPTPKAARDAIQLILKRA